MKYRFICISVLICFVLLAGCAEDQPPILKLIKMIQNKQIDEAMAFGEKLIAENPDNAQAHRFLIDCAFLLEKEDEYLKRYQELTAANPGVAGNHFGLGYIFTKKKDLEAAVPELEKATQLNPSIEHAHYVLGAIYVNPEYSKTDPEKGLAAWLKEEELNPASLGALQVYYDRADYHLRIGDISGAEEDYEKVTTYAFAPEDIAAARRFISRIRELQDELARLEAEVRDNPDSADLHVQLGVLQYKNSKVEEAIATWLKAAELDPNNAEIRNFLGKAYLESNRIPLAAEQFEKAIELDPMMTTAYYNLAAAEENLGNIEASIEHYKKYIELNPMAPRLDEVKETITLLEGKLAEEKG